MHRLHDPCKLHTKRVPYLTKYRNVGLAWTCGWMKTG